MEFPAVIKVDAQSKYKLHLEYNDGTVGIIDLSDIAGKGVFKWWEQDDNFFKVYIDKESGAIAWNAQLDICPDSQYLKLKQLTYEEYKEKNQSHASSIRFYGIIILIFFDDHAPPHFHVKYSEFNCKVSIVDLSVIAGYIPQRAYTLVLEWASLHRTELLKNWELAQQHQELIPIEPLK